MAETLEEPIFTNGTHVRAQIFDATGKSVGGVIKVDTVSSFEAVAPDVVATKDGGTVRIYFSAYNAAGKQIAKPIPIFEKGTVVGDDAYAIVLSSAGKPISKVFAVGVDADKYDEQVDVSVAALAGGGFVITYTSDSIDNDEEGIAAMVFGRSTSGNDNLKVDSSGTMSGLSGNDRLTGDAKTTSFVAAAATTYLFSPRVPRAPTSTRLPILPINREITIALNFHTAISKRSILARYTMIQRQQSRWSTPHRQAGR